MGDSLFSDWHQVGITAVRTIMLYLCALAAVRLVGRRTVAEISAFDVVVTVALGSVVASTALPNDPSLVDGVAVLAGLLLLQVSVGAVRQRFPALGRYLDFRPYVVARGSKITVRRSPLTAQLTEQDVRMMLRLQGTFDLGNAQLVVLEPNGRISVVPTGTGPDGTLLDGIDDR